VVGGPTHGNLSGSAPNLTYTPATNYFGPDSFTFRVNDGQADSTVALVEISVTAVNDAPIVSAGPDWFISLPTNSVTLQGSVSDDEFPLASPDVIAWSVVSGPGLVTFGTSNAAVTTATFSGPGIYVLRLTASDSLLTTSDDVEVIVNAPPLVNAGADQTNNLPGVVTLNGSVTDDLLPTNGGLTVLWAKVSGPGTVVLEIPPQPTRRPPLARAVFMS
jgi:hypothetical protein